MLKVLEEKDWDILLKRIKNGRCIPSLGPGAYSEKISVIFQTANGLVKKYGYPMEDSDDLAQVAQFVVVIEDLITPNEEMYKKIKKLSEEVTLIYFETSDEIHGILANVPLSVYITTNYDDFMSRIFRELRARWEAFNSGT